MTLDEAFKKYDDEVELKRPNRMPHNVAWLKQLKAWGNEESRKMGFGIPQCMIDDAIADDWETVF